MHILICMAEVTDKNTESKKKKKVIIIKSDTSVEIPWDRRKEKLHYCV